MSLNILKSLKARVRKTRIIDVSNYELCVSLQIGQRKGACDLTDIKMSGECAEDVGWATAEATFHRQNTETWNLWKR